MSTHQPPASYCPECDQPLNPPEPTQPPYKTCPHCGEETASWKGEDDTEDPDAAEARREAEEDKHEVGLKVFVGLLTFGIPAAIFGWLIYEGVFTEGEEGAGGASAGGGGGEALVPRTWDGPPRLCDLSGDGLEGLVGLESEWGEPGGGSARTGAGQAPAEAARAVTEGVFGEPTLHLAAWSGETLAERWRAGPLGSPGDSPRDADVSCAGGRVVALAPGGAVYGFDGESGEEAWQSQISGATRLCPSPDGDEIHVESRAQDHIVETQSGDPRAGSAPEYCRDPDPCGPLSSDYLRAECTEVPPAAREREDFIARWALNEGETRVLVGFEPGSRAPMVAGVREGEITWSERVAVTDDIGARAELPASADLFEGRLFVHYEVEDGERVAAFDADTGAPEWDAHAPRDDYDDVMDALLSIHNLEIQSPGLMMDPDPLTMKVSSCRVYLEGASLGVLDSESGERVGKIGPERERGGPGAGNACAIPRAPASP